VKNLHTQAVMPAVTSAIRGKAEVIESVGKGFDIRVDVAAWHFIPKPKALTPARYSLFPH
jgi:hypothetical protein